jgi:hypothetical protein
MRSIVRILTAVVIAVGVLAGAHAYLSAPASPSLPEDIKQAMHLLPADIESVAGTLKPFRVDRSDRASAWFTKQDAVLSFDAILDLNLSQLEVGEAFRAALANIHGREALWAITAKRHQEIRRERRSSMIMLGMHPYESITIIKFSAPLPAKLQQALGWSSSVTPLPGGRQIFRPVNVSAAALIPKPDMLVVVTMIGPDDSLLKNVLHRLEVPGSDFAFDDAVRAWSLVDLDASLWAIRRTRETKPGRPQDNIGRDWAIFTYDQAMPRQARFRSIKARWPWRGLVDASHMDHEPLRLERVGWGGGYADLQAECEPGTGLSCFGYSFAVEALGIMIWV